MRIYKQKIREVEIDNPDFLYTKVPLPIPYAVIEYVPNFDVYNI